MGLPHCFVRCVVVVMVVVDIGILVDAVDVDVGLASFGRAVSVPQVL